MIRHGGIPSGEAAVIVQGGVEEVLASINEIIEVLFLVR